MEIKKLLLKYRKSSIILLLIVMFGGGWIYRKFHQVNNQDVFQQMEVVDSDREKKLAIEASEKPETKAAQKITVDLTGAVLKEGVYDLNADARVNDLINRAGGLMKNADLKQINRAQKLKDQDKIYIPFIGETVTLPQGNGQGSTSSSSSDGDSANTNSGEKININTATASDLMKLNGIGAKKAEQIIAYRNENGPFSSTKDLTKVSGIGEKTFESLQDQITI